MSPEMPLQAVLADWRLEIDAERIAWATFDRQGESQNALGRRPLEELGQIVLHLEPLARAQKIAGLVLLSGKAKGFIVGADVGEFDKIRDVAEVEASIRPVLELLDRLEALPVPVVSAIHGFCLGGGLELALACHWRIATRDESTRLGFPEVRLGIFPGFNGTARAIRQAGALAAMPAMLQGSMIRATAARAMGLVDELVESRQALRWAARKAVFAKRRAKPVSGWKALASKAPFRGLLARKMRSETAKKVREAHYPAPFRLIDLFARHGGDYGAMKAAETSAFAPLLVSDTSRNLLRCFRLSEMMKNQAPKDVGWRPLRVHVIGAGVMGADIAGWCVARGMEVSLQDLAADAIAKGIAAQGKLLARRFRSRPERKAAEARLIADAEGHHIARADVVIEAIVERLEVKQNLFRALETKMKPGAVMATNTSSLMIEDIAAGLADPGRLVGIHFFNPVHHLPLVEVIRGAGTRQEEVEKACAFVTAIEKFPLIVRSCPGFLVNRVLAPYMAEAMRRVERGESKERIDEAARAFGMPMGPIELADTVGLDICVHVGRIIGGAGEAAPETELDRMVAAGKLGKKSGEGFYVWKDGKPVRRDAGYDARDMEKLGRELVEPLIAECERALADGIVASADLVDAGVVFGTGFAPFRGGPLHFRAHENATGIAMPRPAAPLTATSAAAE
jgi:3-hydroxyacyl-CoA dehydrogenase/enoyl-CoA hydratase/3-hydroxybutyryl-CoA epimerase